MWQAATPKCCAPQLPRQFGEGESVVFTSDMVPKTRTLFLKQSPKSLYYPPVAAQGFLILAAQGFQWVRRLPSEMALSTLVGIRKTGPF